MLDTPQLENKMTVETIERPETISEEKTSFYKMYKVIMHNDSKTTMDFVLEVLMRLFEKNGMQAMELMLKIHKEGSGLAGVYPFEGAEFRRDQTHSLARARGFPLTCSIEPA